MPPRKRVRGGLSAEQIEELLLEDAQENNLEEILGEEGNWTSEQPDGDGDGDGDGDEQPTIRIIEEQVNIGNIEAEYSHQSRKKKIQSLDDALNSENYNAFKLPQTEVRYRAVLQKKTNELPETVIEWTNVKKTPVGRQGRQNIITTPGPTVLGEGKDAKSEREAWELFFPKESISKIIELTNQSVKKLLDELGEEKIEEIKKKHSHVKFITEEEFYAFIGLNYARASLQQNLWNIDRCFQETIGHPIFGATMSRARFKFILSHITFDDKTTRSERWKFDRLAAIR